MKNSKLIYKTLGALMLSTLVACGGDDNDGNGIHDPRYLGFANACGVSTNFENSPFMQTVKGQDPSGTTIDLLIYGDGSGSVEVVGEVDIPDLSRLAVGATGRLRVCVSGSGQMEMNVTDPALSVRLEGRNIVIQPNNTDFPFVRGSVLKGTFDFQLDGYQPGVLYF